MQPAVLKLLSEYIEKALGESEPNPWLGLQETMQQLPEKEQPEHQLMLLLSSMAARGIQRAYAERNFPSAPGAARLGWQHFGPKAVAVPPRPGRGSSKRSGLRTVGDTAALADTASGTIAVAYDSLQTVVWSDHDGFVLQLDEASASAILDDERPEALVRMPDGEVRCVASNGIVAHYVNGAWARMSEASPLFEDRSDFRVAGLADGSMLLWGGTVDDTDTNETLLFAHGTWRSANGQSPRPQDWQDDDEEEMSDLDVDFDLVWDPHLATVLRFGFTEIAMWDPTAEVWRTLPVPLSPLILPPDREQRLIFATGKDVLVICWSSQTVWRFDTTGFHLVGIIGDWPDAVQAAAEDLCKRHETLVFPFRQTHYKSSTRSVESFNVDDKYSNWRLDVTPAIAAAASLPARGGAEDVFPPFEAVWAYRAQGVDDAEYWSCHYENGAIKEERGRVSALLRGERGSIEAIPTPRDRAAAEVQRLSPGADFVTAEGLDEGLLLRIGGRRAWSLTRKKVQTGKPLPESRLGGAPAIDAERWPTDAEDEPMAFLFQVRVPVGLPEGAAGVAVFCSSDGSATEDPDSNAVILLSERELTGEGRAPDGAPKSSGVIALIAGEERYMVDTQRLSRWLNADPGIVERYEAIERRCELSFDRVGGAPSWIQGSEGDTGFVAELDFDGSDTPKGYDKWGLFGAIYVFVVNGEAYASWQYT